MTYDLQSPTCPSSAYWQGQGYSRIFAGGTFYAQGASHYSHHRAVQGKALAAARLRAVAVCAVGGERPVATFYPAPSSSTTISSPSCHSTATFRCKGLPSFSLPGVARRVANGLAGGVIQHLCR